MRNRVRDLLAGLVVSFALMFGVASPVTAQRPQAATIDSNLILKIRPYVPANRLRLTASASVILLGGGNGVLNLNNDGDTRDLQGNFLMRAARLFLSRRLNVAMLDAEPAFPAPNGLNNQRLTPEHAHHLGNAIATVRRQWPGKPVWLAKLARKLLDRLGQTIDNHGVAGHGR